MSRYAALYRLLRAAAGGFLSEDALARLLEAARSGVGSGASTDNNRDAARQGSAEIALAERVLASLAAGDVAGAEAGLHAVLEEPQRLSPLETALEELGVELALGSGNQETLARFGQRREAYDSAYAEGAALGAVSALMIDSELVAFLDEMLAQGELEDVLERQRVNGLDVGAAAQQAVSSSGSLFIPMAHSAADDADTPVDREVILRYLLDARTATFSEYAVHWHELQVDDSAVSDLVISFESDAEILLRSIDPEALRVRLFFGQDAAFEEFSTAGGTLRDVEVNPPESRIYMKLQWPAEWLAADIAHGELWSRLAYCVLISESA